MKVYKFSNDFGYANSYFVSANGKRGILIDCTTPDLLYKIENLGLKADTILLTHGHFDHVSGCRSFAENSVKILCSAEEKPLIFSPEYLGIFGGVRVPRFEVDGELKDGGELKLSGLDIKVMSTPGHSDGSVCYLIEDCLFTGDTLFCGSVGRWDLPTGNFKKLSQSLDKIKNLKGDYKIYSGHGEDSTLNHERLTNPYLKVDNA